MIVRRFASEADWIEAALDEFRAAADLARSESRGSLSLCLAGGRSPESVYRAMAGIELAGILVDLWPGDERAVPPEDEASNLRMITRSFSSCAWEKPPRLHGWPLPRDVGLSDCSLLDRAAREYGAALSASLGPKPSFGLALLGLGADGHTMSLFPGSPLLEGGGAAELAARARAPVPPFDRLTLTLAALESSGRIVFLARGRDKAEAVRLLESADPSIPASRLALPRSAVLYCLE